MLDLRDPVSSGTHFFMCALAVFVTLLMRRLAARDALKRRSVTVFGLSMVTLYFASGLFHALQLPKADLRVYQQFDQSAIYLLIAGTYTPIMAVLLHGRFRQFMLGGIWAMATVGIAGMWLLPKLPHTIIVSLYLTMGWFGMLGIVHYYREVGFRGMNWAMGGAFLYTLGAVFELLQWPVLIPGVVRGHEMLHICDMIATFCHVVFIVRYIIPFHRQPRPAGRPIGQGFPIPDAA